MKRKKTSFEAESLVKPQQTRPLNASSVPLVSVVTITFNLIKADRQKHIVECLESVHRQTYSNIEHIVIDGASTDGTIDILQKYVKEGWITLFSAPDTGIYDAMNKGIQKSHGKYVAFLNSDDFWHDEHGVEASVGALEASDADFSVGPAYYLDAQDRRIGVLRDVMGSFFVRMPCSHQAMFVKKAVLEQLGGFSLHYKSSSDFDLVLRMCLLGKTFARVTLNFASFRYTGLSAVSAASLGDLECIEILCKLYGEFTDVSFDSVKEMFYNGFISKTLFEKVREHVSSGLQIEMDSVVDASRGEHYPIVVQPHVDRSALTIVLFDATVLSHHDTHGGGRTGIFVVTYNVLKQLSNRHDVDVLLYCESNTQADVERLYDREFSGVRNVHLYAGEEFNVFLSPFYKIPDVVKRTQVVCYAILYDTIMLKYPTFFSKAEQDLYQEMIDSYTPDVSFFAISENTKRDFVQDADLPPRRITVTPLAASELFQRCDDSAQLRTVREKYGIPHGKRYIFSLCSLEPRKNLIYAVLNFLEFVKREKIHDLIFVLGGTQWDNFIGQLEDALSSGDVVEDKILRIGYVEDTDLASLYSGAFCFIYASLYEGFGLPPLEAMSCACPVITSDNTSLPEVVGDAGLLVDITKPFAVADALSTLNNDPALRQSYAERGYQRSQLFSWKRCVDTMVQEFHARADKRLVTLAQETAVEDSRTAHALFGCPHFMVVERSHNETRYRLFDHLTIARIRRMGDTTVQRVLGLPALSITRTSLEIRVRLFGLLTLLTVQCGDSLQRTGLLLSVQQFLLEWFPRYIRPSIPRFAQLIGNTEYIPTYPLVYCDRAFNITKMLTTRAAFDKRKGRFLFSGDALARITAIDPASTEPVYLDFAKRTVGYPVEVLSPNATVCFSETHFIHNRTGFCAPEPWGTWTTGHHVRFKFQVSPLPERVMVVFDLSPFVSPMHPYLHVAVKANGIKVARWNFQFGRPQPITEVLLTPRILGKGGFVVFEFLVRNPCSAHHLGCGNDRRLLGLGFVRMKLTTSGFNMPAFPYDEPQPFNQDLVHLQSHGMGGFEPWGRWSLGSKITLRFTVPKCDHGLRVLFDLIPFAATERSARFVTVFANKKRICRWKFTDSQPHIGEAITIPTRWIGKDRMVRLTMRVHNPVSPRSAGLGDDDRLLGIGFLNMTLHALE